MGTFRITPTMKVIALIRTTATVTEVETANPTWFTLGDLDGVELLRNHPKKAQVLQWLDDLGLGLSTQQKQRLGDKTLKWFLRRLVHRTGHVSHDQIEGMFRDHPVWCDIDIGITRLGEI